MGLLFLYQSAFIPYNEVHNVSAKEGGHIRVWPHKAESY